MFGVRRIPSPEAIPEETIKVLQARQLEHAERARAERMRDAQITRDRKIYAFKREFFLTRAASGIDVNEANARADEIIAILYPPVTEENADEYLNRA